MTEWIRWYLRRFVHVYIWLRNVCRGESGMWLVGGVVADVYLPQPIDKSQVAATACLKRKFSLRVSVLSYEICESFCFNHCLSSSLPKKRAQSHKKMVLCTLQNNRIGSWSWIIIIDVVSTIIIDVVSTIIIVPNKCSVLLHRSIAIKNVDVET